MLMSIPRGVNPQEAVNGFLRKVRDLENYGIIFFDVKYEDSNSRVGLSPEGISFYQRNRRVSLYDWADVVQVSYKSKRFILAVKEGQGKDKQILAERDSTKATKELWTICAEYAAFYCESPHRLREERDATDLRSPGAPLPSDKDIFGYPNDSNSSPSFNAKVKKSKSLPRKLPSDDPVLIAAMLHRNQGENNFNELSEPSTPTTPGDLTTTSYALNKELVSPSANSMQIILPDIPRIVDDGGDVFTGQELYKKTDFKQASPRRGRSTTSPDYYSQHNRSGQSGNRSHDQRKAYGQDNSPSHHQRNVPSRNEGRGEFKSGSSSRLSKSSHSTTNRDDLSQDDDMDGSLLDLADELGEGESSTSSKHEHRAQEHVRSQKSFENPSSGHVSHSPNRSHHPNHNSRTLPWSYNSPESTPPPKPPRDSPSKLRTDSSSPYLTGSSLTSGHEHRHKQKSGRNLVRKWVQEQQLRSYQSSSQNSLESSSSSSTGANNRYLQPSPDLRASQAHHTPLSPLATNKPTTTVSREPYMKDHVEVPGDHKKGFEHTSNISHYDTLPASRSPRQNSNVVDSTSTRHRGYSTSSSSEKQSQVRENTSLHTAMSDPSFPQQSEPHRPKPKQPGTTQKELLNEIDELMGNLVADAESMFSDAGLSVLGKKEDIQFQRSSQNSANHLDSKEADSSNAKSEVDQQLHNDGSNGINKTEQARHDRRASERKLRMSQRVVNQVLSESKHDHVQHSREDSLEPLTPDKESKLSSNDFVFPKDLKPADFAREEIPVDPRNYIDVPSPIYDRLDNVLEDEITRTADIPSWVEPMSVHASHAPRGITPSSDSSVSGRPRMSSPLGGDNLRDILQEVMEGDNLPPPPAHLLALSQDLETQFSSQRSPEPGSSTSDNTRSISPQPVPTSSLGVSTKATSSLSSVSRSSSEKPSFDRTLFSRQGIDLRVLASDRETREMSYAKNDFHPPSSTSKLPPEIASFMSRVRNKSLDNADSSHSLSQSDGARSSPHLPQLQRDRRGSKKQQGDSDIEAKNTSQQQGTPAEDTQPVSPLDSVSPTYDSPRLVRMEMSKSALVEQPTSRSTGMLKNQHADQQWIDDDSPLGYSLTRTSSSVEASSPSYVSSANPHLTLSTATCTSGATTISTETPNSYSPDDSSPAYHTPRAVHKQYLQGTSSVVYPEPGLETRNEPLNKASSFSGSEKPKGLERYHNRDAGRDQQEHLAHSWHTSNLIGQGSRDKVDLTEGRLSKTVLSHHLEKSSRMSPRNSNPSTPHTPLSPHTHSDLIGHTFTYPNPISAPSAPTSVPSPQENTTQSQHPPHSYSTGSRHPHAHESKPESGQGLMKANPRSRNFKAQSQSHGGADVRRVQTFSSGRDSGWSNRRHNEQHLHRHPMSPGEDSLPNSPTFFTQNNPNDERDTPSPGTQVQNDLFQEHLRALDVRGSKKLRVLDWMQRSSVSWHKNTKATNPVPLKKDVDTNLPSMSYSKQPPIYAAIDDMDNGLAQQRPESGLRPGSGRLMESKQRDVEQRPGSGLRPASGKLMESKQRDMEQRPGSGLRPGSGRLMESKQRDVEQRQRDREQRQKLCSRSAAGYDMEQRHSSMSSRPFSRHDLQQRRLEMERRPNSGRMIGPRPGSGRDVDRSQGQRQAHSFSHPHSQIHRRQGSLGSQHDQRGGNSGPVTSTGQSVSTSMNAGYPSAKFGKDFYVIDV